MNLGLRPENEAATQRSVAEETETTNGKGFGGVKDQKGDHTELREKRKK